MRPKVRIESDGTCFNTHVFAVTDDGTIEIPRVTKIEWKLEAAGGIAQAVITVLDPELQMYAFADGMVVPAELLEDVPDDA